MKLSRLVDESFVKAVNELNQEKLPSSIAFNMSKIMERALVEQQGYFKSRAVLVEKYAERTEDGKVKMEESEGGQSISFGDKKEVFQEELLALNNTEIDIGKLCTSQELADTGVTMSGYQFNTLADLLV